MGKKSKAQKYKNISWVLGILLVIGLVTGGFMLSVGNDGTSITGNDKDVPNAGDKYSYDGKNVEVQLDASNQYTAAAVDPTYYIYDSKPSDWGNGRVSVQDGYVSSEASSSGSATMVEQPGTYYVRSVLSGYYDKFFSVEVPASGDVPLSDWNNGGEMIQKVKMIDVETLSVSNIDLGITTNETSDKTYRVSETFSIDEDEGFELVEVKFQEDATYAFATDSDGDGVYDEGISKIDVTLEGKTYTLFDATASVDEFGGDDLAVINLADSILYGENEFINIIFEVTCDQTLDTTGDADEKCGNGEDFIDSTIFVDAAGNTATFDITG